MHFNFQLERSKKFRPELVPPYVANFPQVVVL